MAMLTFLVTIAVLIALICAGYRFNMRLYANGALGGNPRGMSAVGEESYPVRRNHDASLVQVRDYGWHYARTGILVLAVLVAVIVLILIVLISSVF